MAKVQIRPYPIALSEAQGRRLFTGGSIRYKPEMFLHGRGAKGLEPVDFPMSDRQAAMFSRAIDMGKPITLKLTKAQEKWLVENVLSRPEIMNGSGFWSRLWRGIKRGAKGLWKLAKPIVQPILRGATDTLGVSDALNAVSGVVDAVVPGSRSRIDSAVNSVIGSPGTGRDLDSQPTVVRPAVWRGSDNRFANAVGQVGRDVREIAPRVADTVDAIQRAVASNPSGGALTPWMSSADYSNGVRRGSRGRFLPRGNGVFTSAEQRR